MSNNDNISIGKKVIRIEADAVSSIVDRINDQFDKAVNTILGCTGRLIIAGVGKSGLISQKIASTMASTGTPSHFVHPGDAFHGDLGMITEDDVVLIISNSGETHEIVQILPVIKKRCENYWDDRQTKLHLVKKRRYFVGYICEAGGVPPGPGPYSQHHSDPSHG